MKKWEQLLQFLTGNWPATEGIAHSQALFCLGVTFKAALLYTAIQGLYKLWRDLVSVKVEETVMKYSELLRDRDDSIESQVVGLIPVDASDPQREEIRRSIHSAFQQGAKLWAEQYLPILVGPNDAPRILQKLAQENVI